MISQEEIIKRLENVLQTQSVKNRIAKASNRSADAEEIIAKAESELFSYLPESIKDGVGVSSTSRKTSDGGHQIDITFENVWRPSLDPEGYPRGADSIVLLFNNGYYAMDRITGDWHGEYWVSKQSRDPLYFLQDFIRDFNSKYGEEYGLEATLSPIYDK